MAAMLRTIFSKANLGTIVQLAGLCVLTTLAVISVDQAMRVRSALREVDAAKARRPYQYRAQPAHKRVLIIGDSTGVGVGAECETHSIGGLLAAEYRNAEVVNVCVSGATLAEVPAQLRSLPDDEECFDVILLHAGGNDIVRSPNLAATQQAAEALLPQLQRIGRRVIWLGPGDVGLAPVFRPPFSWWLSRRSRQAGEMFERLAQQHHIDFVGFHGDPHREMLVRDRHIFFAPDGFHPNSHGYRYCYGWLMRSVAMRQLLAPHHDQPAASPLPTTTVTALAEPTPGHRPVTKEQDLVPTPAHHSRGTEALDAAS